MAAIPSDGRSELTREFHTCWHCKADRGSAAAATACEIAHEKASRAGNETLESRPSGD